jgi:hypothetical protein
VRDSVAAANVTSSSNVFYLPAPSVPEPAPKPSRWARMTRTWWRVRFALAGIRLALRPAPAPLFAEDETLAILTAQAELVERRPRLEPPARVIDFDAARARLRPVTATQ